MDKRLGGLLLVFFLLFTVFATAVLLNKQLVTFTRAKEDYAPSITSSLLFAYPLSVKADGTTKSTINVFIRSDKGMPVKDQKLTISSSLGDLSLKEITTDDKGKATVTLTSTAPGIAVVEAFIGGTLKMTQTLSIKFQ